MSALIDSSTSTKTELLRLHSLRSKLISEKLDSILITDVHNIRWLTGFTGSNATLLLSHEALWLFTDGRYKEQVKYEVKLAEPVITQEGYLHELKSGNYFLGKRVGFQSDKLSYRAAEQLKSDLNSIELVPLTMLFDDLLCVKSQGELEKMKRAVAITDQVFEKLLGMISPKVTERDIAAEISYWNKKFGAEKDSFDPIVASGARGALPHARATNNLIQNNSLVVIDMGCMVEGYCSDQTRTVAVGKISDEAKKVYQLVLDAHLLGIESAKVGMTGKELDTIVRDFLKSNGYDEEFGHSLGHSIGLQVHEVPTIGRRTEMKLPAHAVITIEPGLYLPGKFGVRIEDMIYLDDSCAHPLPTAPKELIEL